MNIRDRVAALPEADCKGLLADLLESYTSPAFGVLPKAEVELLMLDALIGMEAVSKKPGIYELVSTLKVTRSKARSLIYERELRKTTREELDRRVKELLQNPLIQKAGEEFVLEVENPLLSDHLRDRIRKLGYVTDGTFSPNLVKLKLEAVSALIESCLDVEEQNAVKQTLIDAGAPDESFRGVVKAALLKVGQRLASDAGEAAMEHASEFMAPLLGGAVERLRGCVDRLNLFPRA